ncbi:MAG TPA: hypothetical protein PKU80_00500 [Candidatus Limiplasma sp.]|nr:hypothetical protein [Candidatus Limiplasma sp.]HRX07873.1 hypothetical protein [Candidatus Limiplasma sp.]
MTPCLRATLRFDDSGNYLDVQMELIPITTSGSAPENDFRSVLVWRTRRGS